MIPPVCKFLCICSWAASIGLCTPTIYIDLYLRCQTSPKWWKRKGMCVYDG